MEGRRSRFLFVGNLSCSPFSLAFYFFFITPSCLLLFGETRASLCLLLFGETCASLTSSVGHAAVGWCMVPRQTVNKVKEPSTRRNLITPMLDGCSYKNLKRLSFRCLLSWTCLCLEAEPEHLFRETSNHTICIRG